MPTLHPKPTSLAQFGALLGDPIRSAILLHLSDGSRRPAGELARLTNSSPQAASAHLAQLVGSGLLIAEQQGRHRFFYLASGEAAEIIEHLANWIDEPRRQLDLAPHLRQARLCYDHLAGQVGVRLFHRMSASGMLAVGPDMLGLSPRGLSWCSTHGISVTPPVKTRRPMVRLCLDWTERRHHVGGYFGAALANWMFEQKYIKRGERQRAVFVTREGEAFLQNGFVF